MMKRIAALLLTLAVALCAALPVLAAGTIEVTEDVSVSDDYDWTRFKGQKGNCHERTKKYKKSDKFCRFVR